MAIPNAVRIEENVGGHSVHGPESASTHSAVSWSAIFAGAFGAAALSLILLMLGVGLGMSSVSPWAQAGISATAFGVSTILWVTATQWLASGLGGYLAGRLRTRWVSVHSDEVYFRDTAHGFLAWAVATLATAILLTSTIGSILSSGIQTGAKAVGSAATAAMSVGGAAAAGAEASKAPSEGGPMGYFVDSLFRKDTTNAANPTNTSGSGNVPAQSAAETSSEVSRIFANSVRSGPLPPEDTKYVGQIVAQRTGLTQQDAEKRVTDTYAGLQAKLRDAEIAARDAADKARKASAHVALWLFISLLIGAFIASLAATFGGRERDV